MHVAGAAVFEDLAIEKRHAWNACADIKRLKTTFL